MKGFSSLLILKYLVYLIEAEESLQSRTNGNHIEPENDQTREAAIIDCLATSQRSTIRLHRYFDYIAGTSTGG